MEKRRIRISVREVIEFVMRSGDIEAVSLSTNRMVDGTKAHQKFQKEAGEDYLAEVPVMMDITIEDIDFFVTGRIDGVFFKASEMQEDGRFEIDRDAATDDMIWFDEIKSTGSPLEYIQGTNELHWAQVRMYAYMFCFEKGIARAGIRLTYIELETFQIKHFYEERTLVELEVFFYQVLTKYVSWARQLENFRQEAIQTLKVLQFPFEGHRKGQKALMNGVYKTICKEQILFSRAPTGIGKTVATLYPALKAIGEEKTEKIFYLTAKTIGKQVAANTLNLFEDRGMRLKRVVITAKEKTCINVAFKCHPDHCIYAKGHYDRINKALEEIFDAADFFSRELIEDLSIKHKVCPYEFSLDVALFSDVIVCDYNYVFDPSAMLRRFFLEKSGKYTLLIDEAHNLVDRAREMYSATLKKGRILEVRRVLKGVDDMLYKYLGQLNQEMLLDRKRMTGVEQNFYEKEAPVKYERHLRAILHRTEKIFALHRQWEHMDLLLDFYFECYDFVKKMELYNKRYVTYYEIEDHDLVVKMFCVNPRDNIKNAISQLQGVIYFSATLLPMSYYIDLLGGSKESYGLILDSPFDSKHLWLGVDRSIGTKYAMREASIEPIVDRIKGVLASKKGNYMVFFPSYKYMEDVHQLLIRDENFSTSVDIMLQERGLTEMEKENFIQAFHIEREKSMIAFAVMGGMFSEGIDLTGEKLSGAIIIGVGLPQICFERQIIKEHFDFDSGSGFEYAYVYPGMNKVLQAAGRVIRTVTDRGIVLLVDERFGQPYYNRLFPEEWQHYQWINHQEALEEELEVFWEQS